jgi:hypothetical protein
MQEHKKLEEAQKEIEALIKALESKIQEKKEEG